MDERIGVGGGEWGVGRETSPFRFQVEVGFN